MTVAPVAAAAAAALLAVLSARDLVGPELLSRARRQGGHAPARRLLASFAPRFGALAVLRRIRPPKDLRTRLAAAGEPGGLRPRDWMAVKAGSALVVSAPSFALLASGANRLGTLMALAGPLAGFIAPDFWLARAARVRSEAAVRELPDLLDLLRVSVAAGIAPVRAMDAVAAQFDGPLAVEWRRVAAAVALGEPQAVAIRGMSDRIAAGEVRAFGEALLRSRRHGLPLAATLATQAARAREARRRRLREQAARAGPKMQLVVALVLVPSMLLVVTALLVSELRPTLGLTP
jgi:tight adherence protein C